MALAASLMRGKVTSWNKQPDYFKDAVTDTSATALYPLGTPREADDGRKFRYACASATVTAYSCLAGGVSVSHDVVVTNTAKTQISGDGISSLVPGQYKGWFGYVDDSSTTGEEAQMFRIRDNSADTLLLESAMSTALADDDVDITVFHPYYVVLTTASTLTQAVKGISIVAMTQYYFGWIQTRGPALVRFSDEPTVGRHVGAGGDTAAGDAIMIADGIDVGFDQDFIGTVVAASGEDDVAHVVDLRIE